MKVIFFKAYQGIQINKRVVMHILMGADPNILSMEAIAGFGILVTSNVESSKGTEKETVLVPFPNVAYCKIEAEVKKAK